MTGGRYGARLASGLPAPPGAPIRRAGSRCGLSMLPRVVIVWGEECEPGRATAAVAAANRVSRGTSLVLPTLMPAGEASLSSGVTTGGTWSPCLPSGLDVV